MKKKLITTWRIALFTFATILFVHLFSTFGAPSDAVRVGRITIPQPYLESITTTDQLTYK